MENISCHILLYYLIFILLCVRTCMRQDQVHRTKVFISFVVFSFNAKCNRYCLMSRVCRFFFCNCVDNFFGELHVHVYFSNQITMAVIANEISTVMGLPENIVSVPYRAHYFRHWSSHLLF